MNNLINP